MMAQLADAVDFLEELAGQVDRKVDGGEVTESGETSNPAAKSHLIGVVLVGEGNTFCSGFGKCYC
jgi:hypothetical protein